MADTTYFWAGPFEDPRRYRVTAEAIQSRAEGGQGLVYRATRTVDGCGVALKQLTRFPVADWPAHVERLHLIEEVPHPALGRHLDAFLGSAFFDGALPHPHDFELPYTVTEWVEGEDLTSAIKTADLTQAFAWIRDVSRATAALHRHRSHGAIGLVHRDIKPSNVRVTDRGAVLIDFGSARPATGSAMTYVGTDGWMPPETHASNPSLGVPGPHSDVWQIGGLASWVLLEASPGARDAVNHPKDMERALRERGIANSGRVARHICRALAHDPKDRPRDLDRWSDELVALSSVSRTFRPARWFGVVGVGVAMIVALVIGAPVLRATESSIVPSTGESRQDVSPQAEGGRPSVPVPGLENCVPYDPATLSIENRESNGLALIAGGTPLVVLDNQSDADQALTIAQQYHALCVVGAGNPRANHAKYQVRYWKDGPIDPARPRNEDCEHYDPDNLSIQDHGLEEGWTLNDRDKTLLWADNELDAVQAKAVAQSYNEQCFVGRGNHRPPEHGFDYIIDYWRYRGL
jgi:serine/threonine protein kinase